MYTHNRLLTLWIVLSTVSVLGAVTVLNLLSSSSFIYPIIKDGVNYFQADYIEFSVLNELSYNYSIFATFFVNIFLFLFFSILFLFKTFAKKKYGSKKMKIIVAAMFPLIMIFMMSVDPINSRAPNARIFDYIFFYGPLADLSRIISLHISLLLFLILNFELLVHIRQHNEGQGR